MHDIIIVELMKCIIDLMKFINENGIIIPEETQNYLTMTMRAAEAYADTLGDEDD